MGIITQYEIEHHFMGGEVPATKRIDPDVRIVKVKEKGEVIIEEDGNKVSLTFGGLVVKINKDKFLTELQKYIGGEYAKQTRTKRKN